MIMWIHMIHMISRIMFFVALCCEAILFWATVLLAAVQCCFPFRQIGSLLLCGLLNWWSV